MFNNVIPFAKDLRPSMQMRERGNYPDGYAQGPRGMIVHFNAGHSEHGQQDAIDCIADGIAQGYTYLCLDKQGDLFQAHDIFKWGYHAGESAWHIAAKTLKLVGTVSDDLIGVEMCNAGKLTRVPGEDGVTRFYPWWAFAADGSLKYPNQDIPISEVRYVTEAKHACPTGWYQKYTDVQIQALIKLIYYMYQFPSFKLEFVLGHHEVAGVLGIGFWRKNDPGGSLPIPMAMFRDFLIANKTQTLDQAWINFQAVVQKYQALP